MLLRVHPSGISSAVRAALAACSLKDFTYAALNNVPGIVAITSITQQAHFRGAIRHARLCARRTAHSTRVEYAGPALLVK